MRTEVVTNPQLYVLFLLLVELYFYYGRYFIEFSPSVFITDFRDVTAAAHAAPVPALRRRAQ